METKANSRIRFRMLPALALAAVLALTGCAGGGAKPEPTATPPVSVGEASFADGRGLALGFKLLYALDGEGGNNVLGTSGLAGVLAAVKYGAAGGTAEALGEALGMQGMQPRQVNEVALRMRMAAGRLTQGRFTSAWCLVFGNDQYVKESYLTDTHQSLQLLSLFPPTALTGEAGNKYLGEWADDSTGGRIKSVGFELPQDNAPFFVDILTADPDWQQALDIGKSRPQPFSFEGGEPSAVPTMVCYQNSGIYESVEGSLAVLPLAGDETRLVVMVPPEGLSLHDFIPVAAAKHDEWLAEAEWGKQRVLLPRFKLNFEGSAMAVLSGAGIGKLMGEDADFSAVGNNLHFSDILHMASLVVDESGVEEPDPMATYRQGVKDDIRTFAVSRPFVVLLETTGGEGEPGGQVLMMGVVRDPLEALKD